MALPHGHSRRRSPLPRCTFRVGAVAVTRTGCCAWLAISLAVSPAWAGGYDRPIETLLPRVVKLYGLGAGAQAGYATGLIVSPDGLVLTVFSLLIDARR